MSQSEAERWEKAVREVAGHFPYPPTPDIAGSVRQKLSPPTSRAVARRPRLAGALVVLLLLIGLAAVPEVRAGLAEFLQIGTIRIQRVEPTATPNAMSEGREEHAAPHAAQATSIPREAPPGPTAVPLTSILELAGESTLAEAQAQVDFPLRLPTYPSDLGKPDHVFLQDLGAPAVVLVWTVPGNPGQVRMSLQLIGSEVIGYKGQPEIVQETTVYGEHALWLRGPHLLQLRGPLGGTHHEVSRLVQGNVLLWQEGEITYRLEADVPPEEAVRIAESLQ